MQLFRANDLVHEQNKIGKCFLKAEISIIRRTYFLLIETAFPHTQRGQRRMNAQFGRKNQTNPFEGQGCVLSKRVPLPSRPIAGRLWK